MLSGKELYAEHLEQDALGAPVWRAVEFDHATRFMLKQLALSALAKSFDE